MSPEARCERCGLCDRADCPAFTADPGDDDDSLMAMGPLVKDCERHAVTIDQWRARAIAAEAEVAEWRRLMPSDDPARVGLFIDGLGRERDDGIVALRAAEADRDRVVKLCERALDGWSAHAEDDEERAEVATIRSSLRAGVGE